MADGTTTNAAGTAWVAGMIRADDSHPDLRFTVAEAFCLWRFGMVGVEVPVVGLHRLVAYGCANGQSFLVATAFLECSTAWVQRRLAAAKT